MQKTKNNDETLKGVLINKDDQITVKSDDFISIYANNVHLRISIFDFSITFGEVTDDKQDGKNIVKQKAKIILTKEMTKVLLALLGSNVKAYEDTFGEIIIPIPQDGEAKEKEGAQAESDVSKQSETASEKAE